MIASLAYCTIICVVMEGPEFRRCSAQLVDLKGDVLQGNCGPPGTPEEFTYNTKHRDVRSIKIDMETTYSYPGDVPLKPRYIQRSIVGNVQSYAQVNLYNPGKSSN